MKVTVEMMTAAYKRLNEKFFNGELPGSVILRVSDRMTRSLGKASYNLEDDSLEIVVSGCYDFTEYQIENTICHEMIHIWQYVNDHKDDHHGYWFQKKAREIRRIDSSMVISRAFNSDVEGKLVSTVPMKASYILVWKNKDRYMISKVHEYQEDSARRMVSRCKKCDGYDFVGGYHVKNEFFSRKKSMCGYNIRWYWVNGRDGLEKYGIKAA